MTRSERLTAQAAVIATVAIYGLTNGFLLPLLSVMLEGRGVDAATIGAVAAASALGTLLASPFTPRLMAAFGLVPCIAVSLLGDVLLILALPLADSIGAWLLIRAAMGMTLALLYTASETWINELAEEHSRGRLMGLYNAVLSASFGAGPLIIIATGSDGWLPFGVAAVIIALAGLPLPLVARHAPRLVHDGSIGMLRIVAAAPGLVLAVLLVAVLYGALWALMPVYGLRLGMPAGQAAALLSVMAAGGVLLQWPIGWLGDRVDRRSVLLGCAGVSMLAAALLPVTIGAGWWLLYPVLFVWGGAFTAIYTMAMAIGGQRFSGTALAMMMAAFGVMWGLGSLLGPVFGGWAMALLRPHGLPIVLFAMPLLYLLAVWAAALRGRVRSTK